jgi:dTDP-4-dehydrorhamnose reductase
MLRLGSEKEEISVVFDQVGTPTYAADLAKTILHIIRQTEKNSTKFVPGVYHFSNEGVASWFDFATAIFELQNIKCRIKPVLSIQFPTPAKRPAYSVLNKSKIKDTFQVQIPYWRDSLKLCLKQIEKI